MYQKVKKDRQEQGASFDFHVQLHDEEEGKASHEGSTKVEDYVLPFTMNDFGDEDDKDVSAAPRNLTAAEEESIRREARREATQQSSPDAASFSV